MKTRKWLVWALSHWTLWVLVAAVFIVATLIHLFAGEL